MAEGSVSSVQDELGSQMKEQLLRLARKRGVSVTLPAPKPGQICVQPATFSSVTGEAACIAVIPVKATPEEELRIIARKVAYVIARSEELRHGIPDSSLAEEEAEEAADRILDELRAVAERRSNKS